MLPGEATLQLYLSDDGRSPFGAWFGSLDAIAAAKVTVALSRLERGAVSNVKGVGEGVLEFRIDYGPGYRIYFGRDGDTLIILLAGGTKRRQGADIAAAKRRWKDYKARKAAAEKGDG